MPTYADLIEVAYKKERVQARRLAKKLGISDEDALRQVMTAGDHSLDVLLTLRRQEIQHSAMKIAAAKLAKAAARTRKEYLSAVGTWLAWFDGACHPNPGKMGIGAVLKNPKGELVANISLAAGHGDSSEAEYLALLAVLKAAVDAASDKLTIYGDSRVVLDDVQGKTAGAPILADHRNSARQLIAQLNEVNFIWIPRIKNSMADMLSQQAIKLPSSYLSK